MKRKLAVLTLLACAVLGGTAQAKSNEVVVLDISTGEVRDSVVLPSFEWVKYVEMDHEMRKTDLQLTEQDILELATIATAEAGNQTELGKRLVIDTVLNRMDHPAFPDTIHGVIFQKGQFSPVGNGAYWKYTPDEEMIRLVKEETVNRTNSDVIFFNAYHYSIYGVPLFQEADHFFSKYE